MPPLSAALTERRPRKIPADAGVFCRGDALGGAQSGHLGVSRAKQNPDKDLSTKVTLAPCRRVDKGPVFFQGENAATHMDENGATSWSEFLMFCVFFSR